MTTNKQVANYATNTLRSDFDPGLVTRDLLRQMTARYNILRGAVQPLVTFYNHQPCELRLRVKTGQIITPTGLLSDLYLGYLEAGSQALEITPSMLKPRWVQ